MAVGQSTTKQTWLLDNVELRGVVIANNGEPVGDVIGTFDDFNLRVDPNYSHIAMHYNTDRVSVGQIHCETYPMREPWGSPSETNHDVPWPLLTGTGAYPNRCCSSHDLRLKFQEFMNLLAAT